MIAAPSSRRILRTLGRKRKRAYSERELTLYWLRFDIATKTQEDDWRVPISELLEEDRFRVTRMAERILREKQVDDGSLGRFLSELESYLEGEARERWEEVVTPLIEQTSTRGVEAVGNQLRIDFDLLNPGVRAYTREHAGRLIRNITDTTRDRVVTAIRRGIDKGEPVQKIAERIEKLDSAFGPARASLIARTETTTVTNGAQRRSLSEYNQTLRDEKVVKTWLNSRDARVRDEHQQQPLGVGGETRDIDEAFSNGLQSPGEPNCRCTLIYDIVETEE